MSKIVSFMKDESGATAIEYGLIAVGIGLAIITAVGLAGTALDGMFRTIATAIGGSSGGSGGSS